MKSLKYAIVSAILALGIAAPMVSGQEDAAPAKAKHGSSGSHDMTAVWLKGITLTADQQKQVDAIKADAKAKGPSGAKEAKEKIRAVLTDDQKTTFDANTAAKGKSDKGASSSKKSKKSKGGESGGGGDE